MSTAADIKEIWGLPLPRSAHVDELSDVRFAEIPIDSITVNPRQPRKEIDTASFQELVSNIQNQGLLQPILVRTGANSSAPYVLVAGERRWRAFHDLVLRGDSNFAHIPAMIVSKHVDNEDAVLLAQALTENLVRSNLSPADCAAAVAELRHLTGWTLEQLATELGMSLRRAQDLVVIAARPEIHRALKSGKIKVEQAAVIARLKSDEAAVSDLVDRCRGVDLKTTRRLVAEQSQPHDKRVRRTDDQHIPIKTLPVSRMLTKETMSRGAVCMLIAQTCEALDWWPQRQNAEASCYS